MIGKVHHSELDRLITIQTSVETVSAGGDVDQSWTALRTSYAKELRASGSEVVSEDHAIYRARRAYLIRKENTDLSPDKIRFKEASDSNYFYCTDIHAYKSSRDWIVIEGEQRDDHE